MLSWGMIAYGNAYRTIGEYDNALGAVKWATDYLILSHTSPDELYGQVGDFDLDHEFWGRPEDLNMSRPAFKIDKEHPGSDLASEAAAALASAGILFAGVNPAYSEACLRHSKELFEFAVRFKGVFSDSLPGANRYYQ